MSNINSKSEKERLDTLNNFQILDTLPEQEFDDLTMLASQICQTPIAAISLIDEERQWFKSRVGLSATETPRDLSFCNLTIQGEDLFIVPDALSDLRFCENKLVKNDPHIRFYAGAPLVSSDGNKLGALCVIDHETRELSDKQKRALSSLSRSVVKAMESRRDIIKLKNAINGQQSVSIDKVLTAVEKAVENPALVIEEENLSFYNRYTKHYLVATAIVVITTLVKIFLDSVTHLESPFLLFACAVMLAAWRGGMFVGIYTTIIALLVIDFYFLMPVGNLFLNSYGQNMLLLIFAAQGIFITILCAARLRGESLLNNARNQLENRVIKRTSELAETNKILKQEIQERAILQEDLRQARDIALESVRLKSDFLANMSHEIRTPMNGVIGVAGLLLDTNLTGEQKRFTEIIKNSGESLLTVINDILDFSKVEAGKLEMEKLDFNLRNTLESTIELLSSRAQAQKNEIAHLILNDVPVDLCGDAGRIQQVLTNLIGNAIKFTHEGNIVVLVRKIQENKTHAKLKFSVQDSGEGISHEAQQKLFQPFTQSDASTTRRFGGTGLGLSICRKLVEMMNGEIGVESELGKGATFWFTVSLEKQSFLIRDNQANDMFAGSPSLLKGKRALIVDDNPINREILVYQIRSWEMEAEEVAGGNEAIEAIEKAEIAGKPFDSIILDLQMPDIDGLETARRIFERNKQTENSPLPSIILLSSSGIKVSEQMMSEAGISKFLTKPYRQSDLLDNIYEAFDLNRRSKPGKTENDIHLTRSGVKTAPEFESSLKSSGKQKRILLVEDNQVNQLVAQSLLKKFGYQTDVAGNGLEAIKALELLPYDLVLMDCQMPEMDGYEATREIRARSWEVSQIPIVALTAHAFEGEREKCLNAGMNDYLSKPIQKEALEEMLQRWIPAEEVYMENRDSAIDVEKNDFDLIERLTDETGIFSAVDLAVLDDITDNNLEMRREVVEMYLAQTITHLDQIENAISQNDHVTLSNVAHKTVGGSTVCGMKAIVEPLRNLERLGLAGTANEAAPFLAQARQAFVLIDKQCAEILSR